MSVRNQTRSRARKTKTTLGATRKNASPASNRTSDRASNQSTGITTNGYHKAKSVKELTRRNVQTIVELEEAAKAQRSRSDLVADAITSYCGSMLFVWVHIIWFGSWIAFNSLAPLNLRFDQFPFTFLTLVVSLEAIFLSTFILISQNHQTRLSERRNHLNLQVDLLSEQENTKMLQLLEAIARQLKVSSCEDPHIRVLEEATRPEQLLEQIDKAVNETNRREDGKAGNS